ncbi:ML5, partial [Symbiodinium sp. KB8]
ASRRARSAPAECRYEDFVDAEINEAKPFTRTMTDRTVSTDYRDFDSLLDTEFERQTSQQSSSSISGMQDSPTAGSGDIEEPCLAQFQTMMIKNIPCRCTAGEVLRGVDSLGFAGTYDFFYLPMNRRHKQGIGYAFINFIELGTAAQFKEAIWGYRFPGRKSTKQVEIAPAQLQGRDEVEAYFSHTQVVHSRYRPLMSA